MEIQELEDELKIVGQNMKTLELSETDALARQEKYEETIRTLSCNLKVRRNHDKEFFLSRMKATLLSSVSHIYRSVGRLAHLLVDRIIDQSQATHLAVFVYSTVIKCRPTMSHSLEIHHIEIVHP